MTINKKNPILVTGGGGYIASWIIKYLLEDGYNVHTTVRKIEDKENIKIYLMTNDVTFDFEPYDYFYSIYAENCKLLLKISFFFKTDTFH